LEKEQKNMKILVVGGAGYIGSHVTRALLDKKHQVTVFDNLSSGLEENLFEEAKFVKGDILDYKALLDVAHSGFDGLIHLAAFKAAGESMLKPEKYALNNISGTINLLNAACDAQIKYIVFSSSAAVYGEPKYLPIDEKHPLHPENFYGHTKLAIEELLKWYDQLKGIKFSALRYFNAAGYDAQKRIKGLEKNPANLIPALMEVAINRRSHLQIFGNDYETDDGTGVRDYIHVTDLAIAHVLSLEYLAKEKKSLILNLGSETGISVLKMVEVARRITGQKIEAKIVERRPGDPAKQVATSQLANAILKWKAENSDVETLISTTWEAYKGYLK
jgi:UDP-glucose 4-epimerase